MQLAVLLLLFHALLLVVLLVGSHLGSKLGSKQWVFTSAPSAHQHLQLLLHLAQLTIGALALDAHLLHALFHFGSRIDALVLELLGLLGLQLTEGLLLLGLLSSQLLGLEACCLLGGRTTCFLLVLAAAALLCLLALLAQLDLSLALQGAGVLLLGGSGCGAENGGLALGALLCQLGLHALHHLLKITRHRSQLCARIHTVESALVEAHQCLLMVEAHITVAGRRVANHQTLQVGVRSGRLLAVYVGLCRHLETQRRDGALAYHLAKVLQTDGAVHSAQLL
mmetsp:Transcript_28511/g.71661  ORF Transcript_28511/g.71661 Transcript_28511/m.71661 type:complete len:281 (+) Transcript_28511:566-1408(+)